MGSVKTDELRLFLKKLAALAFFLMVVNLSLHGYYSDLWNQPARLVTKLGVLGYESLVGLLITIIFFSASYALFRFGYRKCGTALLMTSISVISVAMVLSWLHFQAFDRFVGIYAMQMALQDGKQLLQFSSKMPSVLSPWAIASLVIVIVCLLAFTVLNNRIVRTISALLTPLFMIAVVSTALASGIWNKPDLQGNLSQSVNRAKQSEFSLLASRSGPFTEILSSASELLFATDEMFSIDVNRLVAISTDTNSLVDNIDKRNVVFIVVESLHPRVLAAYGGNPAIMPTVTSLSEKSYVFDRAYAQASHSNYADISAMSGQYPLRAMNIHFYPEHSSYPKSLPYDVLKPYGYRVGLFSSQNEKWGQMHHYLSSPSIDRFSHVGSEQESIKSDYDGISVTDMGDGVSFIAFNDFMYQASGNDIERFDGVTTDEALDWLETEDTDTPFFMYFNFQASHSPFNALPADYEPVFFTETDEMADRVRQGHIVQVPLEHVIKAYHDSLHYVDQNIARVVERLKKSGQHKNTVYVITADTSIRLHQSLLGNGGTLFPDVLRVPLVMKFPDMSRSVRIEEPVEQIDIMPTVLSRIGVGIHPASQGIDMIANRDADRLSFAVAQTPAAHQYSVIYRDWQLLHDYNIDRLVFNYIGEQINGKEAPELSEEQTQNMIAMMATRLTEWRNAQIAYYTSPKVHSQFYPPVFHSSNWFLEKPTPPMLQAAENEE